jgi:N-acylglucosamine-6-phosphate 2-epimerase
MHNTAQHYRHLQTVDRFLAGGLVVSCQPVDHGPMDTDDITAALAAAVVAGGAGGVRIEGARRLAVVRAKVAAPIIGIVKRDLPDSPVRITPFVEDVAALAEAGADIIAVDATDRARPASVVVLLTAIRASGALAMADCSNLTDCLMAADAGFDIVGTTLSGYTGGEIPPEPDYALIAALRHARPTQRIMAEGRFNTPDQAKRAIATGAWAVTVGTAITRTEVVTGWFASAVRKR